MRLLRNPVVVAILAVVALGLIFYQVLWPKVLSPFFKRTTWGTWGFRASVSAVEKAKAVVAMGIAPQTIPSARPQEPANRAASAKIDVAVAKATSEREGETPRRDPFLSWFRAHSMAGTNPPAMAVLTLNAIWRQTDIKLAVINRTVLGEGERILEYKIDSIEGDRVFVDGPNGRESVEFKTGALAGTNSPAGIDSAAVNRSLPPALPPGNRPR